MKNSPTSTIHIKKMNAHQLLDAEDTLAVEEPLEIRITYGPALERKQKNVSVTMRTPGNDAELAIGFLFTEGIIKSDNDIGNCFHLDADGNVILVEVSEHLIPSIQKLDRNFYTSSSCGVCGKASIDAIRIVCQPSAESALPKLDSKLILQLPALLRQQQSVFDSTGGIHASALFNLTGELLILREDVGRHNALDKVIGSAFVEKLLPLENCILLLSGRASFELIQKAAMAGIRIVAAVGAPSSLAVALAKEYNITLIGFLRDERYNIYSNEQRIKL